MAVDKDIALHEIAAQLLLERAVRACPSTVWHFLTKRGLTHKKRQGTRPSKRDRTSELAARIGSTVNSISTQNG